MTTDLTALLKRVEGATGRDGKGATAALAVLSALIRAEIATEEARR